MKEASKTWAVWGDEVRALFKGKGIDIGAGGDTISPSARSFDVEDGDANRIDEYFTEPFDYVFSSHCLEHMKNPPDALQRWWKMVKPGGHLIFWYPMKTSTNKAIGLAFLTMITNSRLRYANNQAGHRYPLMF